MGQAKNFREYQNAQWHFTMFIPNDFTAQVSDESGGVTIQFTDAHGNVSFQVSAWPYQELVVHADGLQLLPPSNNDDQPDELDTVHVYQDGLFEVSFAKNGIAYNVQALLFWHMQKALRGRAPRSAVPRDKRRSP